MKRCLLLLSGLLLWFSVGAQDDFKIIHGPYLQQMGENEVTVVWETSGDAVSWVELAPDGGNHFYAVEHPKFYQSSAGRRVVGKVHAVRVDGLSPGTTYRYRIYSREVTRNEDYYMQYGRIDAGLAFMRELDKFTTFDNSRSPISFTVVNDIHEKNDLLTSVLGNIGERKPNFVIYNGDMCGAMRTPEQLFEGFVDRSVELFASQTPFFYSRGNHETRGTLAYDFLKYFPSPTGEPYYTLRCGPVFFVVLDGGEDKPDTDIEYHGLADYDRYRCEEARWLQEVVESKAFKEAPYRVAIMHIPPVGDDWHGPQHAREQFLPILNRAAIDVMFCGHTHRHGYIASGEQEASFPVLINADIHALDVEANDRQIEVKVRDKEQKLIKTFQFPRKP